MIITPGKQIFDIESGSQNRLSHWSMWVAWLFFLVGSTGSNVHNGWVKKYETKSQNHLSYMFRDSGQVSKPLQTSTTMV